MFNSFSIKSQIRGTYNVNFIEDLSTQLRHLVESKDIIFIIDENVANLFTNEFESIISSCRKIMIVSNEANKTINYSQDIIESSFR